jgi:outer membrane protein assembly factor BamD
VRIEKAKLGFGLLGGLICLAWMGCGGGVADDPILRLSSEEAFNIGKQLMEQEKYDQAREHFAHAFQTAPNSEFGRDALLLQADAYFLWGGETNLIRAENKYRDFNNRYPTSDRASYVQYQIAKSLANRRRKPDRDQTETAKAIQAFEELLALYPTSEHAPEAEAEIEDLRISLAEHEYLVARYQFRRGLLGAAVNRFTGLLEEYPGYPERDKVVCYLGLAYNGLRQNEKATETFAQLRAEHPDSKYCKKIPQPKRPLRGSKGAQVPEAADESKAEDAEEADGDGEASAEGDGR